MSKLTKEYNVEIFSDNQWRVITRQPMTYLQAVRLMLQDKILRRFHERNEARVLKTQ
jgi:hypothetical protein